ncbi:MAG: Smr/MutS family protein [Prevotellaceae bacterium]|jgi:DNA mismatch repair protein MutS2|nr:Smr/MutS family protein [Prevotellaceae bacterium]
MLYPGNIEEKIDFISIRHTLKATCISPLGEEQVDMMSFRTEFAEIQLLLSKAGEMFRLLNNEQDDLPVGDFFDLRQSLARVRIEGLFLDESEVFHLRRTLEAVQLIVSFINNREENLYPKLKNMVASVGDFSVIIKRIDLILNKFGKIKDNASPELSHIRREISVAQNSISRILQNVLRQAQSEGLVDKDVAPALRDGRLVIPVLPASRRKIRGIVHDESASGKTVFIEPEQAVQANNYIRELENEERREIIRILTEFTNFIRPFAAEIINSQYFLGEIDFLRAKTIFSLKINAVSPQMENICRIDWRQAMHPILFLNLKRQGREVVPLDIELDENQRIIIISGPNAGGKSVCLKTVALLQYMLQCGLMLPVNQTSRCGVFQNIFIDIGDEQSIENDLSTYSSHLANMKYFLQNADAKTLLLIDEFGSGTEPQIGGAIAEASLQRLNDKHTFGVITTHYSNIKHFAQGAAGVVNGAMLYDSEHFEPLFRLETGHAGSSFAIDIARKTGLPEDLILAAAQMIGNDHIDYDRNLQAIAGDKRYWEQKKQQIILREKNLEKILANYETKISVLEKQKKEILQTAKQQAQHLLNEANAKIEATIREIKESAAEKEKTRELRQELEIFKDEKLADEKTADNNTLKISRKRDRYKVREKKLAAGKNKDYQLPNTGDFVKIKNQGTEGKIIETKNDFATIALGNIKITAKISNLEVVDRQQKQSAADKYQHIKDTVTDTVRSRKLTFKRDIDLRGMRVNEALYAVTSLIDDAVMAGADSVRILHGTGTGMLRQNIRQMLAAIPQVKKFYDEHVQWGGAGITIVELE